MHPEDKHFTLFVKDLMPEMFVNKRVLDVGSGDINGNNRDLFENCAYDGNDVVEAMNVTVVSKTSDLPTTPLIPSSPPSALNTTRSTRRRF